MNAKIHTMEVNTKIPLKEFAINFPWFRENSCMDALQTKTRVSSSESGDKSPSWTEIGHFHLNAGDPIPDVSDVSNPYTIDEILPIDEVDSSINGLENFIAEKFFIIPEVEYVFLSLENDSINIWTVINRLDREVRKNIYDVEYDILEILKDFQFDFHVICRNDRNIEEFYPSNARMIFQK